MYSGKCVLCLPIHNEDPVIRKERHQKECQQCHCKNVVNFFTLHAKMIYRNMEVLLAVCQITRGPGAQRPLFLPPDRDNCEVESRV